MLRKITITPGGCWVWNGKIAANGYGHVSVDGHPLSGDNLYVRRDRPGRRECKACRAIAVKKHGEKAVA